MNHTIIEVWEDDTRLEVVGELVFVGSNQDGTTFLFD